METTVADTAQPWERQDGEPALWHARLMRWLRMGPGRTLLGAVHAEEAESGRARQSPRVPGAWYEALGRWQWRARAVAFDRAEQQRLDHERARDLESARQRHRELAAQMLALAAKRMATIDPADLTAGDLVRLANAGVQLEVSSIQEPAVEMLRKRIAELTRGLEGNADDADDGLAGAPGGPPGEAGEGPDDDGQGGGDAGAAAGGPDGRDAPDGAAAGPLAAWGADLCDDSITPLLQPAER